MNAIQAALPEPTTATQPPAKRILGIYRYCICRSSGKQTCHSYLGHETWRCDTCGMERVDHNLWTSRPHRKQVQA